MQPYVPAPEDTDAEWNYRARHETPTQRLDRNWSHILQELRVVQTGMQILTGFLLTLPFQQRFSDLQHFEKDLYLLTLAMSAAATIVLVAPAAMHRLLFRRHALTLLVEHGQRFSTTPTPTSRDSQRADCITTPRLATLPPACRLGCGA
ncbi:DUF6328 family protein [Rhodococcus qingshengii]|uniref:DUF6328 family protein n=1 Tax=Rhodococcus qingshengii TaxID=334542 RepID=UPI002034F7B7|nr:DUF6328 family protein [Rhodococcus qingshengii]